MKPKTANRTYMDSFQKIVDVYFQSVVREPFTYAGKTYQPKNLRLSPTIFRGFECFKYCGACCKAFSLEYLPHEKTPYDMESRVVNMNGQDFELVHDGQESTETHHCKHVDMETGWCGVHLARPLSCDFELLRFIMPNPDNDPEGIRNINLNHQPFGRAWTMTQIDGTKGVKCEFKDPSEDEIPDIVRKLKRLKEWTDYFNLVTCLPIIIEWVESGPHYNPLVIPREISDMNAMNAHLEAIKPKKKSKPQVIATDKKKAEPVGFFDGIRKSSV